MVYLGYHGCLVVKVSSRSSLLMKKGCCRLNNCFNSFLFWTFNTESDSSAISGSGCFTNNCLMVDHWIVRSPINSSFHMNHFLQTSHTDKIVRIIFNKLFMYERKEGIQHLQIISVLLPIPYLSHMIRNLWFRMPANNGAPIICYNHSFFSTRGIWHLAATVWYEQLLCKKKNHKCKHQ